MKKYYAVALIVIVVLLGFAFQCPAEDVLDNTTINESNTAVIIDAIERMGVLAIDTVKDVSPQVWKMARSKVMADATGSLICSVIWLILIIVSVIIIKKSIVFGKNDRWDNPLPVILIVVSALALIIGMVGVPVDGIIGIKTLVAIDYYTLMSITQLLH